MARVERKPAGGKAFAFFVYKIPFVLKTLEAVMYAFQFRLLRFYGEKRVVDLIASLYRESNLLLQPFEAYLVHSLVKRQSRFAGDMAEVGTYRGGSAKLICDAKGDAHFFGFDTFEGLPDVGAKDTHWGVNYFRKNQFAAGLEDVRKYLAGARNCQLVPGLFPGSADVIRDRRFSFVHIDTDLYTSTIESLDFFWDRMVSHGMIVIHDAHAEGVAKAIEEFLGAHGEASGFVGALSQYVIVKP